MRHKLMNYYRKVKKGKYKNIGRKLGIFVNISNAVWMITLIISLSNSITLKQPKQ